MLIIKAEIKRAIGVSSGWISTVTVSSVVLTALGLSIESFDIIGIYNIKNKTGINSC
jgi:hypothetical protein